MNEPAIYEISNALLTEINSYLAQRPWVEVQHLMVKLVAETKPQIDKANLPAQE